MNLDTRLLFGPPCSYESAGLTLNDELNEMRHRPGDVLKRAWVNAGVRPLDAAKHHVISGDGHVTGRGKFAAIFKPRQSRLRSCCRLAVQVYIVAVIAHHHIRRHIDEHRRRYNNDFIIIIFYRKKCPR